MIKRFKERLYNRRINKFRGHVVSSRINVGKEPLPAAHESYALRLMQLGPDALKDRREEVKEIGEFLNDIGGFTLMNAVLWRAESLSLQHERGSILRNIEMAWDGIGEWRG